MPELRLLTWNTHGGVRTRREGGTPFDLADVLTKADADVCVLQEVSWPDAEEAAVQQAAARRGDELHELRVFRATRDRWPHRSGDGDGWGGIAVLTRYPARRLGELPLGRAFGDPQPNRRALHLELDVDGTPVQLVAVHLTSRLPHGPVLNLRRLRPQLPPDDVRAVIAGDCNLWGPPVERLLPGWRRAVRGRTWPDRLPHSQIDHVLVRPDVEVLDTAILDRLGSDHRVVSVSLRV